MIDKSVNLGKLVTFILWGTVVAMLVVVWVRTIVHGDVTVAVAAGFTACALSAYAATRNIRCYHVRIAQMIRTMDPPLPPLPNQREGQPSASRTVSPFVRN